MCTLTKYQFDLLSTLKRTLSNVDLQWNYIFSPISLVVNYMYFAPCICTVYNSGGGKGGRGEGRGREGGGEGRRVFPHQNRIAGADPAH